MVPFILLGKSYKEAEGAGAPEGAPFVTGASDSS